MVTYDQAVGVIHAAIESLNQQHLSESPLQTLPETIVAGPGGTLDSLALVTLLVTIEDALNGAGFPSAGLLENTELFAHGDCITVGELAALIQERTSV
jgi:hypothetical protein